MRRRPPIFGQILLERLLSPDPADAVKWLALQVLNPHCAEFSQLLLLDLRDAFAMQVEAESRAELLREETLADLAERFGPVAADVADRANGLTDEPRLRKLRKLALTAPTLEAFLVELNATAR